jgi:hypothetical protein
MLDDLRRGRCRGKIVPYVAEQLSTDDPAKLLADLKKKTPEFENSDSLDKRIREFWPLLPIEARLIACLWAKERSDWNEHLWDRYEQD